MPLTAAEKAGLRALLGSLSDTDIVTLTDTVSNRTVKPISRDDGIDAILMYTREASELLRRRKMKRDVLFVYLVKEGVVPPHTADKPTLIRMIQDLWCSSLVKLESPENPDTPPACRARLDTPMDDSDSEDSDQEESSTHQHSGQEMSSGSPPLDDSGQQLAEHFVPWFYNMWNSLRTNAVMNEEQSQWGPQHFFTDSELKLCVLDQDAVEVHKNNTNIYSRLSQLVCQDFLTFNHHSCKGMTDAYGRVIVMVAGTAHGAASNSGVFEHVFGLLRDPSAQNNWKIKTAEMKLKGTKVPSVLSSSWSSIQYT